VAYLVLNFCALWKKQTTLPSLAYAGIPYQSLGERAGALALMIAWSRSPMARYGPGIAPIFASTALSPSALSARGPGRAAAFFAAACLVVLLSLRKLSVIFCSLSLDTSEAAGGGHSRTARSARSSPAPDRAARGRGDSAALCHAAAPSRD